MNITNTKTTVLSLILLFLSSFFTYAQNTAPVTHKVKKQETIFGISRQHGITVDELINANPEMKQPGYELKKGTIIVIPQPKKEEMSKPQAATAKPKAVNIGIMLPLHDVDGDGKRMLEYYRGFLLAVNEFKNKGINVNIKAWNVTPETDVRPILLEDGNTSLDVIFGPLYTKLVPPIADFCKAYNVKMVIPFSISGNDVDKNPMIYQVYQSPADITEATIRHYLELFPDYHPVIIDCNDTTSQKGSFTFGLRKQLENRNIEYNITNLRSSEESFAKSFSLTKRNIVILNTGRSRELSQAIQKLNVLTEANKNLQISLFGYTEWFMYQRYNNNETYFAKYDCYIPSTFYYNYNSSATKNFENLYEQSYNTTMSNAIPHFAITGYDHARFIIGGIHTYGKNFEGSRQQQYAAPLQTPLSFIRKNSSSGLRNMAFQFVHFKTDGSIESLGY